VAKQPGGVGMPRVADDRVVQLEGVPEQGDRLRLAASSNGGGGLEAFVASTSSNAEAAAGSWSIQRTVGSPDRLAGQRHGVRSRYEAAGSSASGRPDQLLSPLVGAGLILIGGASPRSG
jgi:hypothetical protein